MGKRCRAIISIKKTNTKTSVEENTTAPYFDSNIYPQLIRWLPLKEGYTAVIPIFDYNPAAKTGIISATIQNVSKASVKINEKNRNVWKVLVTDDISDNKVKNTYYIEQESRELLKQEIDMPGRKMVMELIQESIMPE